MIKEQKDDSGSVSLPFGKQTVVGSTVILGDCVEVMKGFADNQFDLAIVDPPYGVNMGAAGKYRATAKTSYTKKNWDISIPKKVYFEELFRISKNQIIWGGNYFAHLLPPSRCWFYWDKEREWLLNYSSGELAWTSFNQNMRAIFLRDYGMFKTDEVLIHPTQKPILLYKWVLKYYAKAGDKIIDTHLGSGSNRIACDNMGFDFTGIEIDKEYFDLSEKRFKQYKSQLRIEGW